MHLSFIYGETAPLRHYVEVWAPKQGFRVITRCGIKFYNVLVDPDVGVEAATCLTCIDLGPKQRAR